MTSLRRIEANRRNALASTGPNTTSGKDRSRRNALTHGFAGRGDVLPDAEAALVAERMQTWRADYTIATPEDEWVFEQLVINAVRVQSCRAQELVLSAHEAERASRTWETDRLAEAEEIAAGLSKQPARVQRRLESTRAGCEWLARRWDDLDQATGPEGAWTPTTFGLAMDLLGVPHDARPQEPAADDLAPGELATRERERLIERMEGILGDIDESERVAASQGMPTRPSPEMRRLHRYEAACLRRYEQARARLLARSTTAEPPTPTTPLPIASPETAEARAVASPEPEPETETGPDAEARTTTEDLDTLTADFVPKRSAEEWRNWDLELMQKLATKYAQEAESTAQAPSQPTTPPATAATATATAPEPASQRPSPSPRLNRRARRALIAGRRGENR